MEQYPTLSPCERLLILRGQLEKAYEQGCMPLVQELSRQIDDIQLDHWAGLLAPAS